MEEIASPEGSMHRVVSLLPAATKTLLAIGGASDLVAICHLSRQPLGRTLPRVVRATVDSDRLSMAEIDREVAAAISRRESLYRLDENKIRELRPTLVLSQGLCPVCAVPPQQVEALSSADSSRAAVLVLTPKTLADVAADIRRLGAAVDRSDAAEVAARDMERRIEVVKASAPRSRRPRVAVIEWFDPLWISGEWIAEMVQVAGGEPVLAGVEEPSRRIEWSSLVAADPDVIVLAACSMDIARARKEIDSLTRRPEWTQLRAVATAQAFLCNGEAHFSSPGPGLARGVEVLGKILRDPGALVPREEGEPVVERSPAL
jgi:iron complex transport system substrate-binding protein